jgi:mannose-6-phosphate isomerase-like protein (cupin superfamily)
VGTVSGSAIKNIGTPDETRKFAAHGWADVVTLPGLNFLRATFQPGWKWSNDVKPLAGTNTCQVHHNGYVESGRMTIVMDDGATFDVGPGDVFVCPPGHDAYTVGDEDCVVLDFSSSAASYAKKG